MENPFIFGITFVIVFSILFKIIDNFFDDDESMDEFEMRYQKYLRDRKKQDDKRDRFLKEQEMREFYLGRDAFR